MKDKSIEFPSGNWRVGGDSQNFTLEKRALGKRPKDGVDENGKPYKKDDPVSYWVTVGNFWTPEQLLNELVNYPLRQSDAQCREEWLAQLADAKQEIAGLAALLRAQLRPTKESTDAETHTDLGGTGRLEANAGRGIRRECKRAAKAPAR